MSTSHLQQSAHESETNLSSSFLPDVKGWLDAKQRISKVIGSASEEALQMQIDGKVSAEVLLVINSLNSPQFDLLCRFLSALPEIDKPLLISAYPELRGEDRVDEIRERYEAIGAVYFFAKLVSCDSLLAQLVLETLEDPAKSPFGQEILSQIQSFYRNYILSVDSTIAASLRREFDDKNPIAETSLLSGALFGLLDLESAQNMTISRRISRFFSRTSEVPNELKDLSECALQNEVFELLMESIYSLRPLPAYLPRHEGRLVPETRQPAFLSNDLKLQIPERSKPTFIDYGSPNLQTAPPQLPDLLRNHVKLDNVPLVVSLSQLQDFNEKQRLEFSLFRMKYANEYQEGLERWYARLTAVAESGISIVLKSEDAHRLRLTNSIPLEWFGDDYENRVCLSIPKHGFTFSDSGIGCSSFLFHKHQMSCDSSRSLHFPAFYALINAISNFQGDLVPWYSGF